MNNNKTIKDKDLARQSTLHERLAERELTPVKQTVRDSVKNKTYVARLTGNAQKAQKVENKDLTDIEGDLPNLLSFNSENSFIKEVKEDEEVFARNDDGIKVDEEDDGKSPDLPEDKEEVLSPQLVEKEADIIHKIKRKNTSIGYHSKKIHISFWEYLNSFVRNTDTLKEKMGLLNKGVENIEERLDIFNILKKFREIDKLKALLLEHDQLMLFNAMPKPEIKLDDSSLTKKDEFSRRLIKSTKFIEGYETDHHHTITNSYQNIVKKPKKSKIDKKLLEIYDDS